jgi:hypothetical protein
LQKEARAHIKMHATDGGDEEDAKQVSPADASTNDN